LALAPKAHDVAVPVHMFEMEVAMLNRQRLKLGAGIGRERYPCGPFVPTFGTDPALPRGPDGDGGHTVGPREAHRVARIAGAAQLKRHGPGPHVINEPIAEPVQVFVHSKSL